MQVLNTLLGAVNSFFWSYLVIPLLVVLALYFTVRSGFVQVRLLPEMLRVLRSSPGTAPDGGREISSFQAFAVSAASRVGIVNIVGVALAIMLGGPGAVFWMWVMAGVLGGAAFVESTLAQLYKVRTRTGFRGGPAYYMLYGLKQRWMGVLFAVVITLAFSLAFSSVQTNSLSGAVSTSAEQLDAPSGWILNTVVGLVVAALTALVIFGGVRRVAHAAQGLVPLMAVLYVLLGVAVVIVNIDQLPRVLGDIFGHAFGAREFAAGGAGAAIVHGLRRGMFSSEAGLGTAANAGAAASVSHPAKQGLVQTLGVYFDTWLMCSVTAFILLTYSSEPDAADGEGIQLTQQALQATLGDWSVHALTLILFLLAFTSVVGNYFYGETNLRFLDGGVRYLTHFRWAVLVAVFLGSVAPLTVVWNLAYIATGVLAVTNLVAMVPLSTVAFRLLADYSRQLRNGLDPQFTLAKMPDLQNVTCWGSADGEPAEAGPIEDGLIEDGLIEDGLIEDGPTEEGPAVEGPGSEGPSGATGEGGAEPWGQGEDDGGEGRTGTDGGGPEDPPGR